MAQFLVALGALKQLRVWEEEINASLVALYKNHEYGRKAFVKAKHTAWHKKGGISVGSFYAKLLSSCLLAEFSEKCYKNPGAQSDFLEVWFEECEGKGSKLEKFLAKEVYSLVLALHRAFATTKRDHKPVKDFDGLLQMAEKVMEDENCEISTSWKG